MEVRGKVVIVTGGALGIGRALCQRFAREGARAIIVADVNEAGAKAVAEEVKGRAVICDVRKEKDIIRLVTLYGRNVRGRRSFLLQCRNYSRSEAWKLPIMNGSASGK